MGTIIKTVITYMIIRVILDVEKELETFTIKGRPKTIMSIVDIIGSSLDHGKMKLHLKDEKGNVSKDISLSWLISANPHQQAAKGHKGALEGNTTKTNPGNFTRITSPAKETFIPSLQPSQMSSNDSNSTEEANITENGTTLSNNTEEANMIENGTTETKDSGDQEDDSLVDIEGELLLGDDDVVETPADNSDRQKICQIPPTGDPDKSYVVGKEVDDGIGCNCAKCQKPNDRMFNLDILLIISLMIVAIVMCVFNFMVHKITMDLIRTMLHFLIHHI